MKKITLISLLIVTIIAIMLLFLFQNKATISKLPVNQYPNALTFTAQIENINVSTRVVSVTRLPTPLTKKAKYEFKVTADTLFIPSPLQIPYLFKSQPSNQAKKMGFSDLKVGQTLSVTTKGIKSIIQMDEALSFQFPPKSKLINGKIVKIDKNVTTVIETNMLPPALVATTSEKPREYKVTVNSDTEISHMKGSVPEKLDISFLKKDMSIQVFYEDEAVTALLISPQESIPVVPPLFLKPTTSSVNAK